MPLAATLVAQLRANQTGANDFGGPVFTPELSQIISLTDGTAAGQANILWADERTVASASNDDLDLNGVLIDAFGATVAAVELVALLVINARKSGAANTTNLTIGGGSNPVVGFLGGTTPTIGPIRPGSFVFLGSSDAAGFGAITAGTGDILRIANSSGAAATYQIAIVARNA
jgi:hypothetical protein